MADRKDNEILSDNWWPSLLTHIPAERPWEKDPVVVAEICGSDSDRHDIRQVFSALVPISEVKEAEDKLRNFSTNLRTSGPHPVYSPGDEPFIPSFSIPAEGMPTDRCEPLVVSWTSNNQTLLQPDQGFLMTYGLMARTAGEDNEIHWDDMALPKYDVVVVKPVSVYDFPNVSRAQVSINRDYLQDYLTIRQVALVQVYYEMRWGPTDDEIEARLGQDEGSILKYPDREIQLSRYIHDRNEICAQVWGARIIAVPGDAPISIDPFDAEPLVWPGIDEPVTNEVAQRLNMNDSVYVSDSVLAAYEGRPEFNINPESGSVSHGNQWSVSYCNRVGRDLIRLEPRKLYEGAPSGVIRHWHAYAVEPVSDDRYPKVLEEPNIGKRAKAITHGFVAMGEVIAELASIVLGENVDSEDIISVSRASLDYHGWWKLKEAEAISQHVPTTLVEGPFLDRCKDLTKLIVEMLSEGKLRQLLYTIGVTPSDINDFRSLKLLDLLVRLALKANDTGITLVSDGTTVYQRLLEEGVTPERPIRPIFALNDLRQLSGHRADETFEKKRDAALVDFGIDPASLASGFGPALDRIYDFLISNLEETTSCLRDAAHGRS